MVMTRILPGSLLFVCASNAIRSPIAEAFMKSLHGQKVFVDSVGVTRGPLDPFAVAAMAEIGVDLSRHRAKTFEDLEDSSFDLVITLSPQAQHHALEATRHWSCNIEYWPTLDPSIIEGQREQRLEAYRGVRDQLIERIKARFGAPPPASI